MIEFCDYDKRMAILDHVYNWFFELATNKYGYVVVNKVLEKF